MPLERSVCARRMAKFNYSEFVKKTLSPNIEEPKSADSSGHASVYALGEDDRAEEVDELVVVAPPREKSSPAPFEGVAKPAESEQVDERSQVKKKEQVSTTRHNESDEAVKEKAEKHETCRQKNQNQQDTVTSKQKTVSTVIEKNL